MFCLHAVVHVMLADKIDSETGFNDFQAIFAAENAKFHNAVN